MSETLLGVIIGGCLANIHHIVECFKWIIKSVYSLIVKKIKKNKNQKEKEYYSNKIINLIQNEEELNIIIEYLEKWKRGGYDINIQAIENNAPNFLRFLLEFYSESLYYSNYENNKKGEVSLDTRIANNLHHTFKDLQIKLELNNKESS